MNFIGAPPPYGELGPIVPDRGGDAGIVERIGVKWPGRLRITSTSRAILTLIPDSCTTSKKVRARNETVVSFAK